MARKKQPLEIKPGVKFHWYDRDLWHIVHIFQDGDYTMVVLKSWAKYKNRWVYEVADKEVIEWWLESKAFKEVNGAGDGRD